MTFVLYEAGTTRSARVRWTLLLLDLPFASREGFDLMGSPELTAVSPLGKVPALVEDGRALFESAAICTWLADRHPERGLVAPPGTWRRALHDQWVAFCLAELEAHLWSTARNSFVYPEPRRVPEILPQNEAEARRALAVLDAHLAATGFLVGDRFSITDVIVGYAVNWAVNDSLARDLAHVTAYAARLRALPHCPYDDR
jgi:glutathione S-transferase